MSAYRITVADLIRRLASFDPGMPVLVLRPDEYWREISVADGPDSIFEAKVIDTGRGFSPPSIVPRLESAEERCVVLTCMEPCNDEELNEISLEVIDSGGI